MAKNLIHDLAVIAYNKVDKEKLARTAVTLAATAASSLAKRSGHPALKQAATVVSHALQQQSEESYKASDAPAANYAGNQALRAAPTDTTDYGGDPFGEDARTPPAPSYRS